MPLERRETLEVQVNLICNIFMFTCLQYFLLTSLNFQATQVPRVLQVFLVALGQMDLKETMGRMDFLEYLGNKVPKQTFRFCIFTCRLHEQKSYL